MFDGEEEFLFLSFSTDPRRCHPFLALHLFDHISIGIDLLEETFGSVSECDGQLIINGPYNIFSPIICINETILWFNWNLSLPQYIHCPIHVFKSFRVFAAELHVQLPIADINVSTLSSEWLLTEANQTGNEWTRGRERIGGKLDRLLFCPRASCLIKSFRHPVAYSGFQHIRPLKCARRDRIKLMSECPRQCRFSFIFIRFFSW